MNMQHVLAGVVLVLLLGLGHWLPWSAVLGRRLHRIESYIYGVGSILVGFYIYLYPDVDIVGDLFILCAVGGAAVCACYAIDWIAAHLSQRRREQKQNAKIIEG